MLSLPTRKAEHERRREQHRNKSAKAPQMSLTRRAAKKLKIDWAGYTPPIPAFLGVRTFDDYSLEELVPYIDWMPFFNAWEFAGKFPDILRDPIIGEAASQFVCGCTAHARAPGRGEMVASACSGRIFSRQQRRRR